MSFELFLVYHFSINGFGFLTISRFYSARIGFNFGLLGFVVDLLNPVNIRRVSIGIIAIYVSIDF